MRKRLEASDSHLLLAEKTRLPFYRVIRLPIRLQDVKTVETAVSQISEDTILGMRFLVTH